MAIGQQFETYFNTGRDLYLGIGRVEPWTDETSPPIDEEYDNVDTWNRLIALKKLTKENTSIVIPRIDWESGEIYDSYVLTDEYNIYKVITSALDSTQKPTGTHPEPIVTSDGYTWKYMMTISKADRVRFLTSEFMPIKNPSEIDDQWYAWVGQSEEFVDQFGDKYFMVYSSLEVQKISPLNISTSCKFRQVSIIKDPLLTDGTEAKGYLYDMCQVCTFDESSSGDYEEADEVYQETGDSFNVFGTVVDFDYKTNALRVTNVSSDFQKNYDVQKSGFAGRKCINVERRRVKDFSGDVIYLDNISPINRNVDQSEEFRIITRY